MRKIIMIILTITFIIAVIITLLLLFPRLFSDIGKKCTGDDKCSSNFCIPDNINCKQDCAGSCASRDELEQALCIEGPRKWYRVRDGTVIEGQGFACMNNN